MSTTDIIVVTALVVVAGQWAENKPLNMRIGLGAAFAAIGLAVLDRLDTSLGTGLAVTALVAAVLKYGPDLFGAVSKVVG